MAPSGKKEPVKERPLLGRPSNNLKIGIVGLPNVGKSSLFNVITSSAVSAENYPFCTIDPSEARVRVPDTRFDWLCEHYKPASRVPAYLTVIDIAGLVKGASSGAGLGNAFLSHIRAVDAIYHVVRVFDGENVVHVEGDVDPIRDMEIIHEELRLKDEETLKKVLDPLDRVTSRGADKSKKEELDMLKKIHECLVTEKKDVRMGDWNAKEIEYLNTMQLLTAKPVIYLANVTEDDYLRKKNRWLPKIKEWIDQRAAGDPLIPFSMAFEEKYAAKSSVDAEAYTKESGVGSALPKIIVTGYKYLQLHYFFTAGADEVRAWTIRKNSKAPQAAGVIHSDFERGFIMAEVMKFDDLKEAGSDNAVKAAGKYYQKGKDYIVEDSDIIFFKFNVTASGKKKPVS